jgi:hypothetical protein
MAEEQTQLGVLVPAFAMAHGGFRADLPDIPSAQWEFSAIKTRLRVRAERRAMPCASLHFRMEHVPVRQQPFFVWSQIARRARVPEQKG